MGTSIVVQTIKIKLKKINRTKNPGQSHNHYHEFTQHFRTLTVWI